MRGILYALLMAIPAMGQEVSPTHIVTHHETVPRFAAQAEFVAAQSGDWKDAATWGGAVPTSDSSVSIPSGISVNYDLDAPPSLLHIEVSGELLFNPRVETVLRCQSLTIMPTGYVQIGLSSEPCVSAKVVFRDLPFDNDPQQHGNGLIVYGKLEAHGEKLNPYIRLDKELTKGTATIPTDPTWSSGDTIVIPGTAQTIFTKRLGYNSESETSTLIGSCEGLSHDLSSPLVFNHFGTPPNPFGVELYPHIANLTRTVIFCSESATGVRGHGIIMGDSEVNVSYVHFKSMGRTSALTPDASNNPDNMKGRYPLHFHHTNGGTVEGCVFTDNKKWGLTVHDTFDCIVTDNIFYDTEGAAVVGEQGNEEGCEFIGNMVIKVTGGFQRLDKRAGIKQVSFDGVRDVVVGADGSGFWFRATVGSFHGNFVYDAAGYGYNYNGYYRPGRPRADAQITDFSNNECASSLGGLWLTWSQSFGIGNFKRHSFDSSLFWNLTRDGIHSYHDAEYTVNDFTIIFDPAASSENYSSAFQWNARINMGVNTINGSYENFNLIFNDLRISGANIGVAIAKPARLKDFYQLNRPQIDAWVGVLAHRESIETGIATIDSPTFLDTSTSDIGGIMPDTPTDIVLLPVEE